MTEAEWLACEQPQYMLEAMTGRVSGVKLNLFGCACCRRVWHLLAERARRAVEVMELYSVGQVAGGELDRAMRRAGLELTGHVLAKRGVPVICATTAVVRYGYPLDIAGADTHLIGVAANGAHFAAVAVGGVDANHPDPNEQREQTALLRDVVGNPFRPVTADPSWLTPTVTALARQMYDTRDFSAMPILADALQDAGCDDEQVLGHCRGPGPHARGCWVVDLALGKA